MEPINRPVLKVVGSTHFLKKIVWQPYRLLSLGGHVESQENKKLCFYTASLALNSVWSRLAVRKRRFLFSWDSTWPRVTEIYCQKQYSRQVSCTLNIVLIFSVADCKSNWHQYKTGCVRLFTIHKIFGQARQYCKHFQTSGGVKGDLVEIMSRDDNERIDALASEQGLYSRIRMQCVCRLGDILEIQLCVNEQ